MYFYIGDVTSYRKDPHRMAVELSIERILAAAERYKATRTDSVMGIEERDISERPHPRTHTHQGLFVTNPDV
jgi:hypothetical protein